MAPLSVAAMSSAAVSVSRIVDAYRRRTPTSAKLAAAAKNVFPDGITHDAFFTFKK